MFFVPERYVDGSGVQRICGDCDLKASQHYPVRFGCAVAECFLEHYELVKETAEKTQSILQASPTKKEAKDTC